LIFKEKNDNILNIMEVSNMKKRTIFALVIGAAILLDSIYNQSRGNSSRVEIAIDELKDEVCNKLSSLEDKIEDLESKIDDLESTISSLEDTITSQWGLGEDEREQS
jgi:peptidoglycan hydrolase CwlO-like protein